MSDMSDRMMTLRIAAAELRYMAWSVQTAVTFAALFGVGFLLTANAGEFESFAPGGAVKANSPYSLTDALLRLGIACLIAVPPYVAGAVLRDGTHRFDRLVFATPISRGAYLHGRFAGAFGALMLALAGAPLGLLAGSFWPWADRALLGPTRWGDYAAIFFGVVTPSMLVVSALLFAVAAWTRSLLATYLAAMGLLVATFAGTLTETLPPLLDPFLYRLFASETRYWTAVERNSQLLGWGREVLVHRALWLGLAGLAYGWTVRRFSLRQLDTEPRRRRGGRRSTAEPTAVRLQRHRRHRRHREPLGELPRVEPRWGLGTAWSQLVARTRFEVRSVVGSAPFLVLAGLATLVSFLSVSEREVLYGVDAHPLTRLMTESLTVLNLPMLIVLGFYAAELFWREREIGSTEVLDATPAPNWAFVTAKVAALVAVLGSLVALGTAVAIALQVLGGDVRYEPWLYLRRGVVTLLVPMACVAVLACCLQVLARGRYLGMLLFGCFFAAVVASRDLLGWEHPLASYGLPMLSEPFSDMNGFGGVSGLAQWTRVYWCALAGLLLVFTYLLWNRGAAQPLRLRLRALRGLARPAVAGMTLFFLALGSASGAWVYYNTNVLHEYLTRDDGLERRVEYERTFAWTAELPMPTITAVDLAVDLYPSDRRAEVRGIHELTNRTASALSTIHVMFPGTVDVLGVEIAGMVEARRAEGPFDLYFVELAEPMEPGESRELRFAAVMERRGFLHGEPDTSLVANGTFLLNLQLTPHIGFRPDVRVDEPRVREAHGLPPVPRRPALEDRSEHGHSVLRQDSGFLRYGLTVSTAAGQTVVASGHLVDQWTERTESGERRTFRYETQVPIRNFYSILSAEYAVARDRWNDVSLEIYHHPSHDWNTERMMGALRDSLEIYSRAFGPYQFRDLRVVEFPAYDKFAQSFAGAIPYSEDMGFVADVGDDDLDMPYYVTAHEVAHQWFGHQVTAANVQGDGLIHETLSQYAALLVMEERYGEDHIRPFLKAELDRYLAGRGDDPYGERPLMREEDQSYISYRKGSVVMYLLRDQVGTDTVNRAIRRLLAERAFRTDPYATSRDFVDALLAEADPEHEELIRDLFERITLHDVAVTDVQVEELPSGRYRVALEVEARQHYADERGVLTEAPFDLAVDIGLFTASPDAGRAGGFDAGDVVSFEKHRIRGPRATLEIEVDRRPTVVGIDPYSKLVDRQPEDNLAVVR